MVAKKVLFALLGITTATFLAGYAVESEYVLAGLSIAAGAAWLLLEIYDKRSLNWLFFLIFTFLAILGCLKSMSSLLLLTGFAANLAAWDLSRFLLRSSNLVAEENSVAFEKKHVYKLAITIGAGFLVALLPVLITFSLSFVVLFFIILLAMFVLRWVILYVYRQNEKSD
jgi:hypothetical protein